jgi:hypothetical protein
LSLRTASSFSLSNRKQNVVLGHFLLTRAQLWLLLPAGHEIWHPYAVLERVVSRSVRVRATDCKQEISHGISESITWVVVRPLLEGF